MKNYKLILFFIFSALLILTSCKKAEKEMSVSTGEITSILTRSADALGKIIDMGDGATQYGHCYAKTPDVSVNSSKTELGKPAGTGNFSSQLANLEPGTKYYIRAYLSNGTQTVYGKELNFSTLSVSVPILTTTAITSITTSTAASGGNITNDGETPVTIRGVCWNTATGPTTSNTKTTDGSGTGSFTSSLTGLTAGTKYYVRAYATNNVGTGYGSEVSFTALPVSVPTVTTTAVTSFTATTAAGGGNVTDDGGTTVTARGVCWNTTTGPTIASSKTTDGSGTGIFTSNMTSLIPGTTYYVRAYATNNAGTGYGNEVSFTTTAASLATLSTNVISGITQTTAVSGGNISSDGGATVTLRGVCWNTSTGPTTSNSKTTDGSGTGSFSSSLTGLTAGTVYYVRAYAINAAGTAYGNERSFMTNTPVPVIPTLTTNDISDVTPFTATSGGFITNDGGAAVTARGVCWSTLTGPTTSDFKTTNGPGSGSFTSDITGLTANTTYFVRAYAINSVGTAYGNEISFTTSSTIPTLTTTAVTSITATTAVSGGDIPDDGGAFITARGVCWSTSQSPTITDGFTVNGSDRGNYSSNLTGLTASTTYYVRAYATNSVGTAYGNQVSFTTRPACIDFDKFHPGGDVAPISKAVHYGTVETNLSGANKCWITQNLGADNQASSATDATEASAGWYWQFSLKQGYKHDGTNRTPATTWTDNGQFGDWTSDKDPCTILLGTGWRIPTMTEWTNVYDNGGWANLNDAYASVLKLHTAGYVDDNLYNRGSNGCYWSITYQYVCMYCGFNGGVLNFNAGTCQVTADYQRIGHSVRCIRD